MQTFNEFNKTVFEKDEHKKSSNYKKLTPKMKTAVDELFSTMEKNPSDFLTVFDKTVKSVSKKNGVREKDIMSYFDKEMLSI